MWATWHSRNLFVFEGNNEDSQVSLAKAEVIVESYRKIKSPSLPSSTRQNCRENQSWKPPPMGWFKVNVDAATKLEEQVPGLGVVIRNSEGNFIAAAQKQVRYFGDVTAAETKAIKLGIKTAKAANCVPLIIECHCQEAVDLALGRKSSNKEICWTILDIQEKLKNYTTPHYNILLGFIIA
ncbi:uncharacterized protein LOC107175620 [Citrus sinensis]|uniref:uncharacterized protein LOC107175620 n=1 Tax=Citrus sinensis TaxID=2711 RepID=UPI000763663E|nr:uncharacterized protein LOC107175620 [Citrus sinensis]XP_024046528.1 uncharacterized protein LOC112100893 [Citrus x clementina]